MKTTVIIPARFASSRFPGKPLIDICGKPMIQHVYERANRAEGVDKVIVATDSEKICDVVKGFAGNVVMTSSYHPTGTDRIAEVASGIDTDTVINLQGDEPLIEPKMITEVANILCDNRSLKMATMCKQIQDPNEIKDPNIVKVVRDKDGFALYFSRTAIPFVRALSGNSMDTKYYKHVGIYAYKKDFLLEFVKLPESLLEKAEKLEQLRALEHGVSIKVVEVYYDTIGVDTPEDLETVKKIIT